MKARIFAAILAAWAGLLAAGPAGTATVDGGLLTNVVSATVAPYIGVPSGTLSYSATATVMVCTPTITLNKRASMTVVGAGGAVTFCIELFNQSSCASAFNVRVTDPLQVDLAYITKAGEWVDGATSIAHSFYIPLAGAWQGPEATPGPAVISPTLAWEINMLAMGGSGYVCYRATVK